MPSRPSDSPKSAENGASAPLTVKQQRDAKRAEKVAAFKREQDRKKRNRTIGIVSAITGAVAVVALVVVLVIANTVPPRAIEGLKTYDNLSANHVAGTVDYAMTPPAGGDHAQVWLNCGIYTEAVPTENAVHDLEHGAVWVTYDPAQVDEAQIAALQDTLPDSYIVLSPFEGMDQPIYASAWGAQVAITGADDPNLQAFLDQYWRSADAPEPGASCTGGLDAPGLVS